MPRMSIVIPVYNAERYLRACLASVLGQTMRDVEVICVDDGSTDGSSRILDECAARDARLCVIHQRNAGAGAARNAGMDRATGDVLLCVDADDTLAPDACEVVTDSFARTGCEVMCFGFTCEPADRTPAAIANQLHPRDALIEGFHPEVLFTEKVRPFSWRCALSREFCERVGARYDEALTLGDDQYFLFYVYPRARRILLCSRQLYAYRMTDASMMHAASASGRALRASSPGTATPSRRYLRTGSRAAGRTSARSACSTGTSTSCFWTQARFPRRSRRSSGATTSDFLQATLEKSGCAPRAAPRARCFAT